MGTNFSQHYRYTQNVSLFFCGSDQFIFKILFYQDVTHIIISEIWFFLFLRVVFNAHKTEIGWFPSEHHCHLLTWQPGSLPMGVSMFPICLSFLSTMTLPTIQQQNQEERRYIYSMSLFG